MKRNMLLLTVFAVVIGLTVCCQDPEPLPDNETPEQENKEPVKLENFKLSLPLVGNRIFEGKPTLTVTVENPNDTVVTAEVKLEIYIDKGTFLMDVKSTVDVAANETVDIDMAPEEELGPGFYKARFSVNKKIAGTYVFGISPYDIVSAPDMQPDFDEFWAAAKAQLPELKEGETVTLKEIASRSSAKNKVYLVEMQSVPNGLEGDPVIVRGFYVEPQDGQKHPVLMHFFGWDDRGGSVTVPSGGSGNYAEFYLSTRGQYHNNRAAGYEKTDEWIAEHGEWQAADPCRYASILNQKDEYNWFGFNFGDKNGFYYRGAFMDCVQAVRFMATRPTSDMNNLFSEGSSQGGALSYATAALSDYPFTAIAANVAFLGDYPDYFDIVGWPGNVAKANQGSMTDEEMYAFLSYFDTKNLATKISCAVIASSGLMDGTCPPHTNFAPFNNLNTQDKEMIVDPKMGHDFPAGWSTKWGTFFKERMK